MKNITNYLEQREALEKAQSELRKIRDTLTDTELASVLAPPPEFREHKGVGGPLPEQIRRNNTAILGVVRELGFSCACMVPEDEVLEDGSEDF